MGVLVRILGSVTAAAVIAAFAAHGVGPASAEELVASAPRQQYLLFSGFDLWRAGGFAHGGVLWSPEGLGQEGFTLKLLLGAGSYRYRAGVTEVTGKQVTIAAMPGWRFKGERFEGTLFLGPDLQNHHFSPDDPGNGLRGTRLGVRVGGDLWYQPTDWMMTAASASASSLGSSMWGRIAAGWRLFDWPWLGPELVAFGDGHYWQARAGIHATTVRTGQFEWSLGFGYDADHRDGLYGRIGLLTRQ
jgi:hypothetical protein